MQSSNSQTDLKVQTDKKWIFIFAGAFGVFFMVSLYALIRGQPSILSKPFDPDSRPCGIGDLEDYPYIYFVNPQKTQLYRNVCIKQCPKVSSVKLKQSIECATNSVVRNCQLNIGIAIDIKDFFLIYDSYAYLNKVCLPANNKYFEIIREKILIGKIDLIFNDITSSFPLIIFFSILCALLSYYSKYFLDNDKIVRITYFTVFFLSAVGCFILGIVLFNKFVHIIFDSPENKTQVLSTSSDTYQYTSSQNSSLAFYLFASLMCFYQFFVFVKDQVSNETMKNHEITIKIFCNIPEVINARKYLEFLPIFAFFATLLLFLILFIVERNIFSIVRIKVDIYLSPFDRVIRGIEPYVLNIFIIPIFIWMISIIIQTCEYITLQSTYYTLDSQKEYDFKQLLQTVFTYRMGTIIKGAFLIGFTDWIRTPLELFEYNFQEYLKNNKSEDLNCVRRIQQKICNFYQSTELKSYTKYAYIDNVRSNKEFVESGLHFQNEILDKNRWIESLVDMSEIFENQMNISICMIITILFYLLLSLFYASSSISSFTTTQIFVLGISFLISLFQVNMYGTTYCCIILQYTITQIESSTEELTQAKFLKYLKKDFQQKLKTKFSEGENAPAFIKFCNQP
ncbi:hypothetical protein ABPG72_022745 [Tetrahymena utriculariae]